MAERGEREEGGKRRLGWAPNLLGDMQLPLHLRGEGVFLGGNQKKEELLGDC
jgi:hypothetical protein